MNSSDLLNAVIDLQTRFAFQEDLVQSLNQIVAQQSQQIEQLQVKSRELEQALIEMQDMAQGGETPQMPPPHY